MKSAPPAGHFGISGRDSKLTEKSNVTEAKFWLLAAIAAFIGGCAIYLTVKGVLAALEGTQEALFRTAFYMMLVAILLFIAAWVLSLS